MTFDEACELAKAIRGNSKFEVVAIGRFVPLDTLSNSLPWAVSVLSRVDGQKATVWNEDDWRRLAVPKRPEPKLEPKVEPKQVEHSQPMLF